MRRNGYELESANEGQRKAGRWFCRRWCYQSHHNWFLMKSLQIKNKANGGSGEFFKESCVNLTSKSLSCSESCEGVYRTFSGCCNNLVNTEYGQAVKCQYVNKPFPSPFPDFAEALWIYQYNYCRKNKCPFTKVTPNSLWARKFAQRGTGGK